jgi:hypothetical protein
VGAVARALRPKSESAAAPYPGDLPSPFASWPWPDAKRDAPHRGVTHWLARSTDGTELDLLQFDFNLNPALRLELYDQDEDDEAPYDNSVRFWPRGVGGTIKHLEEQGRGPVVAAWNGLFFASEGAAWSPEGVGRHVAPVVLDGKPSFNVGNHRWTFGLQYCGEARQFKTLHLPDRAALAREFTYAAAGAQCLVFEGLPLRLEPYPTAREGIKRGPVPSSPEEVGHIPAVDHVKTSRTSMGWSKDSRQFYLLIVTEPDHEAAGNVALRRGEPQVGGWSVADLQRFWLSQGAWGAVNIDGGAVTQMAYRMPDARYMLLPPRWAGSNSRVVLPSSLKGAPEGGTLMYFYVRDVGAETGVRPR